MFNRKATGSNCTPFNARAQTGASLIEVLVTVVITSIGLLGMGGVMIVSQRVSQDSFLRTQANTIAQTMIESMHINSAAVALGEYNRIVAPGGTADATTCETSACSPARRAQFDLARLSSTLEHALPNATASVSCTPTGSPDSPGYDGICKLEIGWSLRAISGESEASTQTQVWHFQP